MNTRVDAVVVGAGFAGLYLLHRLRGLGLSVRVFEAGDSVGGTWYWNRYPGARCDIESLDYSYSFSEELQREWRWTERYPSQPEILRYLNHVADRFDLRREISFGTAVTSAVFDETAGRWTVGTDCEPPVSARFLVMATGCLSDARIPDFPGLEEFTGRWFHTARWPTDGVELRGQRVGVIGTGSSGIQIIPIVAQQAQQLTVFQRTPAYSLPAHNRPLEDAQQDLVKRDYPAYRQRARRTVTGVAPLPSPISRGSALAVDAHTRLHEYQRRWEHGGNALTGAFADLLVNPEANESAAQFVRDKIAAVVQDPATAKALSPDYPYAAKRPCVDTDYYATFNRDNVTLVDLREQPLARITPRGVATEALTGAAEYELDTLIFATGFDAFTGALSAIDIQGRNGLTLAEKWAAGPRAYLGAVVAGFPNLFLITGPGSPSVLSNMVVSIEQHVEWISELLGQLQRHGHDLVEPAQQAEDEWLAHSAELARRTVYDDAKSWYLGANVPGKPRVFLPYVGGVGAFAKHCASVAAGGYRELVFTDLG